MATDDKGGGTSFDRDFGYLMPFLDKVASAASSLPGPARAELETLLSGEKARWQRIRELLSGKGASRSASTSGATTANNADLRASGTSRALTELPASGHAGQPELSGRTFTVGALRKR